MRKFDFYAVGDAIFADGDGASDEIEKIAKTLNEGDELNCIAFYTDVDNGRQEMVPVFYTVDNKGKAIKRKVGF